MEWNENSNKISIVLKIVLLIILFIIIFVFLKLQINRISRVNDEKENYEKISYYLKDKYNVSNIKYEKRENLLESYNTIAGDSGSGRRKLDSYIYYYKFTYNNINTYAYVIDGECSDDYYYEKKIKYISDRLKQFTSSNIKIVKDYIDPEELLINGKNNRKVVFDIGELSYNIIDKKFMDNYAEFFDNIDQELNGINLNIFLKFKDNIVLLDQFYNYDEDENDIVFKRNTYKNNMELIEELDAYSFDSSHISSGSTEETIKWCLKVQSSYTCENENYEIYKNNKEIYNILDKNNYIKYKVAYENEFNDDMVISLYTEDFKYLNEYFDELKSQNIFTKERNWELVIFNNYKFYNTIDYNDSKNNIEDIVDNYSKKLKYEKNYNYNIYVDYINSNNKKYKNYFLIYTNKTKYCKEKDDICTVLYGIKN